MTITIAPILPSFVAEIGDVDLAQPLATAELAAIKAAFWRYAVLIFPDQVLPEVAQIAFACEFGPLEGAGGGIYDRLLTAEPARVREELVDLSNLTRDGQIWSGDSRMRMFQLGNRLWHTDSSYSSTPALASLLYARSAVPPLGGHTEFADERAAYDALPAERKRQIEELRAEHSIFTSRARIGFADFTEAERAASPPVIWPLVRTIPESGQQTLYLASHAGRIIGLPEHVGCSLLEDLVHHATQRQFVYTHRWRPRDLVMWDNRCTMHRGMPYDDLRWKRDMVRATVSDLAAAANPDLSQNVAEKATPLANN
jgi:alpha-ketoglutarate-dependent 2,4-dichlorophenoxyacetate dioxygenase